MRLNLANRFHTSYPLSLRIGIGYEIFSME
jgi:hypothetical protein